MTEIAKIALNHIIAEFITKEKKDRHRMKTHENYSTNGDDSVKVENKSLQEEEEKDYALTKDKQESMNEEKEID